MTLKRQSSYSSSWLFLLVTLVASVANAMDTPSSTSSVAMTAMAHQSSSQVEVFDQSSTPESRRQRPVYPEFVSPVTGSRLHWTNSSHPPLGGLFYSNHSTTGRSSASSRSSNGRSLAEGDFASLIAILDGATIDIPGEFEHDLGNVDPLNLVGFFTGDRLENKLQVKNIQCRQLMLGDLVFDVKAPLIVDQVRTIPITLTVVDLDFDCEADYHYTLSNTDGRFFLYSRGSDVHIDMTITTAKTSPRDMAAQVLDCVPNVVISDIDVSTDSFLGKILNAVEAVIRGPVRDALNGVVCDELRSVGTTTLPDLLQQSDDIIEPYLQPVPNKLLNPLYEEEQLLKQQAATANSLTGSLFNAGQFMNFLSSANSQNDATDLAHFLLSALDEIDAWLGGSVTLDNGQSDLGINMLLRDTILDANGAMALDMTRGNVVTAIGTPTDSAVAVANPGKGMTLVKTHDKLLELSLSLDKITLFGLDSMTRFDMLQRIGQHTLQTQLAWEFFQGVADLSLVLKPSTLEDTLWSDVPANRQLVEQIQLTMTAKEISSMITIFLAIHQTKLGQLPLGGLMHSTNILKCTFATVYQGGNLVAGLNVNVGDLVVPTFQGFSSPGLNRVLTEAMELLFELYERWMLQALPHLTQTKLRAQLNDLWNDFLTSLGITSGVDMEQACRVPQEVTGMVDFRDFFLTPDKAKELGGTGLEPYGDIVPLLFELLHEQLLVPNENDPDKRLQLNNLLLDPLTKAQSGTPGMLHFPSDLVSLVVNKTEALASSNNNVMSEIAASLFEYFELRLYDTKVRNINTIVDAHVLKPSSESPHLLQNKVQFGPIAGRPLNASVRVLMSVHQPSSGNATGTSVRRNLVDKEDHIMDISLSAMSLELVADLMAMVDAKALMNFQLQDIADPYCWLATMPAPALTSDGKILPGSNNAESNLGMKLEAFLADFEKFALDLNCVNEACAQGSLGALQELSKIWQQNNVTAHLAERYQAFATELLTGDYAHNRMARWLDEAPGKCLHREEYSPLQSPYPPLELPVFSLEAMDTMLFSALTATQAGFLALSGGNGESLFAGITVPSIQPRANLSDPTKRYMDFTDNEYGTGSLGELISYLLSQANVLLGVNPNNDSPASTNGTTSGSDSGINGIVKDMLSGEDVLEVQFQDATLVGSSNLQLRLNSLRVVGLDTFTHFNIFDAVEPHLLHNSLRLDKLSAEIDLSIVSASDSDSNEQRLVLSMTAQDIDAFLPVFVAIDIDKLDAIQLGSLLDIKNILPCILTAVEDIHVPAMKLSIGSVSDLMVKGLLPASNAAFETSSAAIADAFGAIDFDEFLGPLVQGVINGMIRSYVKDASCTNIMQSYISSARRRTQKDEPSFIDFRDLFLSTTLAKDYGGSGESPYGDLFRTALAFVEDLILDVDPATKLSSVNELLIAPLTEAVSKERGSLIMSDTLVDVKNRVNVGGLDAMFTFRASDAKIQNLDTMGAPIDLLAPVAQETNLLNNTASIGVVNDRPLRASIRLLLGLEGDENTQLRNDLELTMDLHTATLVLTALLKVAANEFAEFPIGDILNSDCWLAKMPAPSLDKYGFRAENAEPSAAVSEIEAALSKMNLRADCYSCTSPGLRDFDTEGSKDIDKVANRVFDYAADVLGGRFLQTQIDRALNHAAKRCPHDSDYEPNFVLPKYETFEQEPETSSTTVLLMILIATAITIAVLALIVLARLCFVRARHRRLLKSLPDRQLYLLQKEQESEDKRERELNAVTSSLFASTATIPAFVRFVVPVVILGNIGFFLSGHLSLGATVNIHVQLAGQVIRIDEFFSFSMVQSTIDIWNAGGKALAALIFIFSGIWPYTKSVMTLMLWFLPPSTVSMTTRGSVLIWLDTLAKWSMIDIFVLLVSIAGFRVSIVSPNLDFLPEDFYAVDLLVVPAWGLYANMIAQLISQVSSHVVIYYHRRVVNQATLARRALFRKTSRLLENDEENVTDGFLDDREQVSLAASFEDENSQDAQRRDRLCSHAFVRPHSNNARLVPRGFVNPFLVLLGIALSVLVIVGCILPSYSLEVLGILGVLVESGNRWEQAVQKHSVLSTTKMLMDQAAFLGGAGNYLGLGTLSTLLVVTVLIVPLTQTFVLLVHWFAPMTRKARSRMENFLEGLQAWQYVEVYIIATVVATWQLGPISQFMINAYCGSLDSTFDMMVYYGILNEEDAQCFQVEAGIESAAYILVASAVLLAVLNTYIGNASRQYFRDIDNKSKKETFAVPKNLSATLNHDEDSSSGPGQSVSLSGGRRPGLESRGNSFNDEGQSLLEADPLAPPSTNLQEENAKRSDPLAPPEDDGNTPSWRRGDALKKIHPVPVLFSDKFRWTLVQSVHDTVASDTSNGDPSMANINDSTDSPSEEEARSLLKGDFPDPVPSAAPSSRDDNSLKDGFEEVELGEMEYGQMEYVENDDSDDDEDFKFKDEVVKVSDLDEGWESESDDGVHDAVSEMGNTHAMSIDDTTNHESTAFSLNTSPSDDVQSSAYGTHRDESNDSVLLDSNTDDAFSAVSDDPGIPQLRSELADFDRQISNDPDELDRRLAGGHDVDDDGATQPSSVFVQDDTTARESNRFEDEVQTANDSSEGDYSFETATNTGTEEEIVVQTVDDPQPIRLQPRRASGFPDNNFRGSINQGGQGNSKLQDAFMS
ncbi:Paraquat-inducible protein A [Seminavis robusta]|uniref:Paraquat-inducible protein A n=1 Tax=Seminavis robusta TaxID=568900 RepID=A0A9N8E5I4_9STRA|nr:Paraquat-inducible protein A [Seminavis robusta]|eukprot:Sro562_g167120.1 Paraquat-inducible protein A (2665) ;mRNA; f:44625-52797